MKQNLIKSSSILIFLTLFINTVNSQLYEWRGPGRSGIYNETGLLKKWPAALGDWQYFMHTVGVKCRESDFGRIIAAQIKFYLFLLMCNN